MAYDRFDRDRRWREGRPDFSDESMNRERDFDRGRDRDGGRDERGFFDRMGEEVRSWFGEDDDRRDRFERDDHRDFQRDRERSGYQGSGRDDRHQRGPDSDRGYRPIAGDYSRAGNDRDTSWDRADHRRTGLMGSREASNHDDRHYSDWRRRQMEDMDREYDDYRRERQGQFESDFGSWREKRQSKRQLLAGLREHMEVVGSDDKHVGTVDRIAGDRIILTRSDPDAGGAHHSLSCTDLDRIEGDKAVLDCTADKARERWRDESRSRALFEREDQGSAGPHMLDRSFSGTYR